MTSKVYQTHQRIPALREMMYGKDKARYAPLTLTQNAKRQYLIQRLKQAYTKDIYNQILLRFVKDIRDYDFSKPIPTEILEEIDFDEVRGNLLRDAGFVLDEHIEIGGQIRYASYIVRHQGRNFLSLYRGSGRYMQATQPSAGPLLYCIPIR